MTQPRGDDYIRALQATGEQTRAYYEKSIVKTEQQKFLEQLLLETAGSFATVADVACGGGTLTYHLRRLLPRADFTLCDLNPDGLRLAKELNGLDCTYLQSNIYDLSEMPDAQF